MRAIVKFCEREQASTPLNLRANRANAKFCEQLKINYDHSISLKMVPLLPACCPRVVHDFDFQRNHITFKIVPCNIALTLYFEVMLQETVFNHYQRNNVA